MAMNLALDTNAYVAFCKGQPDAVAAVRSVELIALPYVVLAELKAGFLAGERAMRNEERLAHFLSSPRVEVLYADEQTLHHYARLFVQLRKLGKPIPTNDLWIASLALQHNLALLTGDAHFGTIPQLALWNGQLLRNQTVDGPP